MVSFAFIRSMHQYLQAVVPHQFPPCLQTPELDCTSSSAMLAKERFGRCKNSLKQSICHAPWGISVLAPVNTYLCLPDSNAALNSTKFPLLHPCMQRAQGFKVQLYLSMRCCLGRWRWDWRRWEVWPWSQQWWHWRRWRWARRCAFSLDDFGRSSFLWVFSFSLILLGCRFTLTHLFTLILLRIFTLRTLGFTDAGRSKWAAGKSKMAAFWIIAFNNNQIPQSNHTFRGGRDILQWLTLIKTLRNMKPSIHTAQ